MRATFSPEELSQALEFAKQEFELGSENDPDSKRSQLISAQKQIPTALPELENLVQLPESCFHIWFWFNELNNTRSEGFSGTLPITYSEIKSYFDLMKIEPTDQEISLIKRFDVVYLNYQRSKQK